MSSPLSSIPALPKTDAERRALRGSPSDSPTIGLETTLLVRCPLRRNAACQAIRSVRAVTHEFERALFCCFTSDAAASYAGANPKIGRASCRERVVASQDAGRL